MNISEVMESIGLGEGETKVYLALLKLGSSPVSVIKQETDLHRTTIYDFIEKLLNKGLVNYVVKNNVKYFKATNPNKLLEYVKEKEEQVQSILPDLNKLSEFIKDELLVEVYKGKEGFKTMLNKVLKVGKEFIAFNVDETKFEEMFPVVLRNHFAKSIKMGVKERLLTVENPEFTYKHDHITYKKIPKKFFSPTPTAIFGNNVAIIIWQPFTVIMIENAALADSYRKHFELLWDMAK